MRQQEFQPLDSAVIPRFAEPATFMRAPYVHRIGQYRRQLSRIDSMVNPPESSHLGHDQINKKRIERFRKQL